MEKKTKIKLLKAILGGLEILDHGRGFERNKP
jgi:hypothetical protein